MQVLLKPQGPKLKGLGGGREGDRATEMQREIELGRKRDRSQAKQRERGRETDNGG